MNHKVLLADDSLTIQKVIKITLANQPFDIVDCTTDDELFKKLPEVKPEIVLLDFNLSEKFSGYELATKIKSIHPSARILLLLGTFDTIDDAAMERCGASDKIVKPFDSNKFIAICKRFVDSAFIEDIKFPEPKKETFIVPKDEDQWKVNHTVEQKAVKPTQDESKNFDVRSHLNPLDKEVSDWGMSIPGVINDKDSHDKAIDLPSVIGEVKSLGAHREKLEVKAPESVKPKEDAKFPANDDLDYPTIEQMGSSFAAPVEEKPKASSKLLSIETFNDPKEFEIEHNINSMNESDVTSIEAQIRDEVEEDLWKVDEFEDLKREVAAKIEEVKSGFHPSSKDFDESLFKAIGEEEIQWLDNTQYTSAPASSAANADMMQELRAEMDAMIKKHVKEYMDQMFAQKVEKIAWEVIPDLAENIIRQEVSKIANKVLNDSN